MAARHPLVVDDNPSTLRVMGASPEAARTDAEAPSERPTLQEDERGALEALEASIPRAQRGEGLRPYRGAFVLAALAAALIATAWYAGAEVLSAIEHGARGAARNNTEQSRWVFTVAVSAVAVLGFVIAWGRATMLRRPVRLAEGRGRMSVDEVAGALRQAILEREDVRSAEVRVVNLHRHGLGVAARLRVSPRARIDEVIDAFEVEAEGLIEGHLGVPLDGPPTVDVHYDELDLRAGRLHV